MRNCGPCISQPMHFTLPRDKTKDMVEIVYNRNCVYQTAYHVIWCPKYRKRLHVVLLRRLRTHRRDPLRELPRRRLLPRVRQRALGRIRAAALHQGPDGRPRPHHLQVPRTRGQGGRQGPHRRSSEVRSARTALSLSAVRLLLDRGRQHHDRGGTVGQGPSRGRDRPRGLAGRVTDFPA